ncbi:F-box/kelch-repeat protein At3g23880-like [Apium graveolens]|uniref:F-box/kelch-repeat protein At3g23880-like n=1 Tax=Apium graveolens TaxID=4045 RepID=UPI003D79F9F7
MAKTSILPLEIIETEILPRLPVRSLLRFKSVCKSWNSFISSNAFNKLRNFNYDFLTLVSVLQAKIIGCINGLVFIEHSDRYFVIWNLATKHRLDIAAPCDQFERCDYVSGFGFDSVINDYKCMYVDVVKTRPLHGYIYSCRAGCWKKISSSNFLNPDGVINKVLNPVIVNGSPFWLITRVYDDVNIRMTVMSIDVRQESFRLLPDLGSSSSTFTRKLNRKYTLLNFRDSLAVMFYSSKLFSGETIDIHIFNEKCGNWSKTSFGPFNFLSKVPTSRVKPRFLECFRNGDILFLSHKIKRVYWVDLENYTIKCLGRLGVLDRHAVAYSESLVFIDGMKTFYKKEDMFQFFLDFVTKDGTY